MYEQILQRGTRARHYWRDMWRYRELFYTLAWRDISVRYRQMVIGTAWVVIQPLVTMIVMTVVFGKVARLQSEGSAPYALMVLAGMLPWQFFSTALTLSSNSLLANTPLIAKVYFPRMIIPASSVITTFIDLLIGFAIVLAMLAWFHYIPNWRLASLPVFMALAFFAVMGLGLLFAALNVTYRDFKYVIPFIVQFGLYISPVGYSSSVVHHRFGDALFTVYCLNPMVGIIDGFRWAILGGETELNVIGLAISVAISTVMSMVGIWYFRRTEHGFADII